jgi:hypothetical protein
MGSTICAEHRNNNEDNLFGMKSNLQATRPVVIQFHTNQLYIKNSKKRKRKKNLVY